MISSAKEKAKKAIKHIDEKILALKKSKKGSSNTRNFLIDKAENTKKQIESTVESQRSVSSARSDNKNSFEIDVDSRNVASTIDKLESSVVHDVDSIIEKSDDIDFDESIDEIYGVPVVAPAAPAAAVIPVAPPVAPAGPAAPVAPVARLIDDVKLGILRRQVRILAETKATTSGFFNDDIKAVGTAASLATYHSGIGGADDGTALAAGNAAGDAKSLKLEQRHKWMRNVKQ